MLNTLSDLDTGVRYTIFFVANVVLVLWTKYIIGRAKAGWPRVLLATPMFAVCLMICFLFDFKRESDRVMLTHVVTNYMWLTPWKIFGFCLNRCQLTRAYDSKSLSAFVVALLYNVNVAFETKPRAEEKKNDDAPQDLTVHPYDDVSFVAIKHKGRALLRELFSTLLRVAFKIFFIFLSAYFVRKSTPGSFVKTLVCNWYIYFFFSGIQDITLFLSLLTLNLQLEDNFRRPWVSTSVAEFWNSRWNRVMGAQLREVCYEPMAEGNPFFIHSRPSRLTLGQWIAPRKYLDKVRHPLSRRFLGMLFTFFASGLIHAFMVIQLDPTMPFPYRYAAFFVVCSFIVILETTLKQLLKKAGWYSMIVATVPNFVYNAYVLVTLQVLGYYLFWPDMLESGGIDMGADAVLSIINVSVTN